MRLTSPYFVLGMQAAVALAQRGSNSSAMYQLSSDAEFAFILGEMLSLSNSFGASTGEVLRAASQITPGDFESWYKEWKFLADDIHGKATSIDATRFPVSARETFFRSASYYRAADFFLYGNGSDPRIYSLWDSATSDFNNAIELLSTPADRVNISATNFTVTAIFYGPRASSSPDWDSRKHHRRGCANAKLPTVVVGGGYDSAQEESYHQLGRSVLDRGWNFVTYEGPGQPTVRRQQQQLGFIPNWWDVITPTMDYLASRSDVDMGRVTLVGLSFGGSLAPIAASREHHLSAVLAVDGLTSLFEAIQNQWPPKLDELFANGDSVKFDEVMIGIMGNNSYPTQLRWLIGQSLFAFDTPSPFDWLTRLKNYTVDEAMLRNITCPVFVGEGENDSSAPGQAEKIAAILGNQSTLHLFKTNVGAEEHYQLGAEAQLAQVSLDWLADVSDGLVPTKNTTGGHYNPITLVTSRAVNIQRYVVQRHLILFCSVLCWCK